MSHRRRFVPVLRKIFALVILLVACAGALRAQNLSFTPGFVTAIAGDPTFQAPYSSTSPSAQGVGPASSLVSSRPFGMVFDKDGNLYFADRGLRSPAVIWVIASGRGTLPLVPIAGGSPIQGNAYVVAGGGLGQAGTGSCATTATDPAGDGCAATDAYLSLPFTPTINVDSQGNLYINDGNDPNSGNPLGLRVVLASSSSTVAGLTVTNPVAGHIYQAQPTAYSSTGIDSHGNLYFHNGSALQVQYQSGTVPGIAAGSPAGLYTIAGGPNANCDYGASAANAAPGGCGNGGPATNAILTSGGGSYFVQIDPSDNIYLVDNENNVVRAIYVSGSLPGITNPVVGDIYTIAGNGQYGREISGVPATQSPLYNDSAFGGQNATTGPIAFDAAGDLYIAQVFQDFVRVDQSGILTTVLNGNGIPNANAPSGNGVSSCLQATDGLGDGCPANQVDVIDQGTYSGTPLSTFEYTQGIAIDASGNLYESDTEVKAGGGFAFYGILHKINTTTGQVNLTGNVGSVVAPQTVQIYNSGSQALTFTSLAAGGADFSIVPTGGKSDCAATTTLAPGTTCQIAVSYTPSVVGNVTGSVNIASNALNATGGVSTLNLLGVGLPGLTGTTLTINPGEPMVANLNQTVTFTAMVGPPNGGIAGSTPTGTVTFTDQNGNTYGPVNVSQASGSKSGVAVFSTTALAAGSYTITAAYSGDSNFEASTSAPQPLTIAASSSPAPTVTLTASASSATSGQSVTLTATVTSASGSAPTGTVTFAESYQAAASAQANANLPGNILGAGTLSGGTATLTTTTLPTGANAIVAYYGGDSSHAANASASVSVSVTGSAALQIVPGVIHTIAGSFGQSGYTGDGGAASSATLNIAGFTSDPAGNIYIADSSDNVVRRIASGPASSPPWPAAARAATEVRRRRHS